MRWILVSLLQTLLLSLTDANPTIYVNQTTLQVGKGNKQNYIIRYLYEYILEVNGLPCDLVSRPPRVTFTCKNCTEDNPVLVVIRQSKGVLSWELPLVSLSPGDNTPTPFLTTSRILCPYDLISAKNCKDGNNNTDLTITLSTSSKTNMSVAVDVKLEENFFLRLNEEPLRNVTLTPATPLYLAYKFPADESISSVFLRVHSPNDSCMTVSIQHIHCPVYDLERNVQFDGYWQFVTQSSGFTIGREAFPDGFYVVFVAHAHDEECSHGSLEAVQAKKHKKIIQVSLQPTISKVDYVVAMATALASLVGFSLIMIIMGMFYMRNLSSMYPAQIAAADTDENEPTGSASAIETIQRETQRTLSTVASPRSDAGSTFEDAISTKTDSSLDETDVDMLNDLYCDKEFFRTKGTLFVCDLSRKAPTVLGKKSNLYLWYLITVAIFYFLPVVQLVITYQKVLHTTGNQNLCYYNFLCAHPLGILSDFNHVYSNIAYVVLGTVFMFLTRRRQLHHNAAAFRNKAVDKCYGIPQHFGLFYAMGTALIVEGILSACYHVCPNHYNFQFDTSFMYVISTMCMLKIYHTRHADVSATAYATFALLAATIFLGMVGVLYGTPLFWTIFTVIHLTTCFGLSVQIYYLGQFRFATFSIRRVTKEIYMKLRTGHLRSIFPTYPSRFLIIFLANLVNWSLAVLGPLYKIGDFATYLLAIFMINLLLYYTFYIIMKLLSKQASDPLPLFRGYAIGPLYKIGDFATYLLAIFMINLLLYYTFYIIMKICSKEKIGRTPALFIFFSTLTWFASFYFFINKSISWKLTPAQSRLYNQPCKVLSFYDNHDIWHFLSATSMFFSFMVLLTLDDDLLDVPREKIAVF